MRVLVHRYHDDSFGVLSSGDELEEDSPRGRHREALNGRPYSDSDLHRKMAERLSPDSQTESAEWFCGLVSRTKAEVSAMLPLVLF